ncbi:MAG: hypothetical protein KDA87_25005, partial [Planctomycetales bacterium]|nr:hypothetical protein [Planctomycetales bacterium]
GLLVMSFSTHGQLVWYRLFQGAGRQSVTEMMVDEQGEIYVNGDSRFWPRSQPSEPLELTATESNTVTDPLGGLMLRMDRDGRLLAAANSAGYNVVQMIGTTENGPLLSVRTRQTVVVGGLLLEPQFDIARYVLQLDPTLTTAKPWYVERATVSNSAVDSAGVATVTAASTASDPDAPKESVDSSSIHLASVSIDNPPALPAAREVVVFTESFEAGDGEQPWAGRWETDEQNDWFRSRQRAVLGEHSAEVDGAAKDATLTLA